MILMYLFHVSLISKNSINPDRLQKSVGVIFVYRISKKPSPVGELIASDASCKQLGGPRSGG